MRDLAQTPVVAKAAGAAALTAAACYPRLALWFERPRDLGFLETALVGSAFFLWAAVFAWHERYSGRPVADVPFRPSRWAAGTLLGLGGAAFMVLVLDPVLRPLTPEVYPTTGQAWAAQAFFTVAFVPLCVCFAPLAFALRLLPTPANALVAAVVWALAVTVLKFFGLPQAVPPLTAVAVLAARGVAASVCLWLYWEGGLALALWWTLLLELRHLASL